MNFKNISDHDQVKMMNNNDKISTFSYIRKQTMKDSKTVNLSSFPPVTGSLRKDGFNT